MGHQSGVGCASRGHGNLEQYHENVIQNLNTALVVVDTDGLITASNPPAEQILGETPDSLRGESVSRWFGGTAGGTSLVARTLSDGSRFRAVESMITRVDGTRVPIGISWAPLFDSAGTKLGAVATFQDISGLKSLQTQVLQTEKMASIGQLAAGVAHEINNPMGFIHANLFQMSEYVSDLRRAWEAVESLRKAVADGDGDEVVRAADSLTEVSQDVDVDWLLADLGKAIRESQEGSERIRHIVQDLRDFSHHDTGERVLVDVNQCLESTVRIVWPMMKHLVELEHEYGELPNVYGYPMQLKQVFMNLLVNAYQAVEEQVGNTGKLGRIWLTTSVREDGVAVVVRDTGAGISSEHVDRIFDPFFTTKKVGSGTGLGLSTSYSIVKRHGGSLEVESRPREGATFVLFLPHGAPESGLEEYVGFE